MVLAISVTVNTLLLIVKPLSKSVRQIDCCFNKVSYILSLCQFGLITGAAFATTTT